MHFHRNSTLSLPTELWNEDFTKYSLLNPIVPEGQYDSAALFLVNKQFCANITNFTSQNEELTTTTETASPPTTPPTAILILKSQPMLLDFHGRIFNENIEIYFTIDIKMSKFKYHYLDPDLKKFDQECIFTNTFLKSKLKKTDQVYSDQ